MVTKEFAEASAELNKILEHLPNEYIEKIPTKLIEFFQKVESKEYNTNIDPYKQLSEQKLLPKTKTLLSMLYRNYWCNEEERKELDSILAENDRKYEMELREKYNPDNIFKRKDQNEEIKEVEETKLIVYENKVWYKKAFEFIENIFKKLFKK